MWFLEGEPDKDWPFSYVSPIEMENQGLHSSKIKNCLKKMERVCNLKLC